MQMLHIDASDNSPEVILDGEKGYLLFDGKCYPENTFDFFEPILNWIESYFKEHYKENSVVDIKLTYFNSATTQILFDILDIFQDSGVKDLQINWYYDVDNENGLEDYEDFSEEFPELNIQAVTR